MSLKTASQYYNKKQALNERKAYCVSRQKQANGIIEEVNEHIDVYLEQAELIYKGKKAAEENGVNQELWKELENIFFEIAADGLGEELLLERAKEKNPDTLAALSNLIEDRKRQ